MDITDFFQLIPNIAVIGLALIILIAVWMIWRSIAPAAPGISLGYYELLGRYAGQKLIKRIRGTLVDSTALFLNPDIERDFKTLLLEDIEETAKRNPEKQAELNDFKKQLETAESISSFCRVIGTREKIFTKHVLIQWGHVDKPINAYAANDPQSKFTLGFGFLTQGIITGEIYTFPQPWNIYKLGKVHVHLFRPDMPHAENAHTTPPEWLAKIALYIPASVELNELVKSKDEQLKEKDRKLMEMGKELAAAATERDALRKAVQGFTTTGEFPTTLLGKKFDFMDFTTIALPTVFGYLVVEGLGGPPLAGIILGNLLGAYFVFRRK